MDNIGWLLAADPAIRWQALRDLDDASPEVVKAQRDRVATRGWGAALLDLRDDDGQWAGGACFPADHQWSDGGDQPWTSTLPVLALLRDFGLDPASARATDTIARLRDGCRWEYDGSPFFNGEVEPCINGRTVALGAYFGQDVDALVGRVLGDQLDDGGWNCATEDGSVVSSFHSTICVLEGLLEYERARGTVPVTAARQRGEEYLLERRLMYRLSTGELISPAWQQFSFPVQWHYDVLRGLDYFRAVGGRPDHRLADAIELVRDKRQPDGTWLLENTHPGKCHFALEDGDGEPSRWNTLRALRVLRWYDEEVTRSTADDATG